jgi:hypothetical protein
MALTKKQKDVLKNILDGSMNDIKKELQEIINELDLKVLKKSDSGAENIKFRIKSIFRENYDDGNNLFERAYDNIYVEYSLCDKKRYKFDATFSYEIFCHAHSGGVEEITVKLDSIKGNSKRECLSVILSEILTSYSCMKKHFCGYVLDQIYEQIKKRI